MNKSFDALKSQIFLAHHGILDMKWGVRNGPPYPLDSSISTGKRLKIKGSLKKSARNQGRDDFILKKGYKLRRSTKTREDNDSKHKYFSATSIDSDHYRGYISSINKKDKVYESTYKTNNTLNMAGADKVREIQNKILEDKKRGKAIEKDLIKQSSKYLYEGSVSGYLKYQNIKEAKKVYETYTKPYKELLSNFYKTADPKIMDKLQDMYEKNREKINDGLLYEIGKARVDSFVSSIKDKQLTKSDLYNIGLGGSNKAQDILFEKLKSEGYHGMIDVAGIGTYRQKYGKSIREGVAPVIIIDASANTKKIKVRAISGYRASYSGQLAEKRMRRKYSTLID